MRGIIYYCPNGPVTHGLVGSCGHLGWVLVGIGYAAVLSCKGASLVFVGSIHVLGCCCRGATKIPWLGAAACAGKVVCGDIE